MRLFKKLVVVNKGKEGEKKFYTFYLKLENGMEVKIQPNSYEDKSGNKVSNYRDLCLIASPELPFDK